MFLGAGAITDYGSWTPNCTLKQWPYKIPVLGLSDVELYIDGASASSAQILHTCGPSMGTIESVSYEGGPSTDPAGQTYSVMKNFSGSSPTGTFVIAVTASGSLYFSPEYSIADTTCSNPPTLIEGCYGNIDPLLAWDCNGKYFRGPTPYEHKLYIREAEVTINAIKNTFKQGRTRSFRTEKEKIFLFNAEWIPEWYLEELDAVFHRGEVYIDGVKYLVDATNYEKLDDCVKAWRPTVTLKKICMQSFSCEADPCSVVPIESGTTGGGGGTSGSGGGGTPTCCDVTVIDATRTIV